MHDKAHMCFLWLLTCFMVGEILLGIGVSIRFLVMSCEGEPGRTLGVHIRWKANSPRLRYLPCWPRFPNYQECTSWRWLYHPWLHTLMKHGGLIYLMMLIYDKNRGWSIYQLGICSAPPTWTQTLNHCGHIFKWSTRTNLHWVQAQPTHPTFRRHNLSLFETFQHWSYRGPTQPWTLWF